ncbi:hypothetical protein BD560DRAFT_409855 [Blakeslea trispora]|nr:hypothetical protein BD560DRAFT_409855 [Blakeslea trispora]
MPENLSSVENITTDQPLETDSDLLNIDRNEDYQAVLKALEILKRQQQKAVDDLDSLKNLKSSALEDPYAFLSSLKHKQKSKLPRLQKVISVPSIDWGRYRFLPESRLAEQTVALCDLTQQYINQARKPTFCNILDTSYSIDHVSNPATPTLAKTMQHELQKATQAMRQIPSRANSVSDFSEDEDTDSMATKTTPSTQHSRRAGKTCSGKGRGKRRTSVIQTSTEKDLQASSMDMSETESPTVSRLQSIEPRTPDDYSSMESANNEDKSQTFKQPWTDEEQARLQELLITFPDEPVQAQRFNKISKALGTRTPRQVASRVQKYFIKLAKMGLPVPGRITIPPSYMPKSEQSSQQKLKMKAKSKAYTKTGRITKPSSSARSSNSNVGFNSVVSGGITTSRISGAHYVMSHGPPAALMSDDEEDSDVKEMMRTVNNGTSEASDVVIHEGYACDGCGAEPIVGVLYKCTVCDVSEEVDLCSSCMEKGNFTNDHHTLDHTFEAVRTANPLPYYADNDYKSLEHLGEYSYLDF